MDDDAIKRLPHGPHKFSRDGIDRDQRVRVFAAMIELIGRRGYPLTTVAEVLKLARISRRSFYELFANKRECLLAICCLAVVRYSNQIHEACGSNKGELGDRLTEAFAAVAEEARMDPALAKVLLVEAQAIGVASAFHIQEMTADIEIAMGDALSRSSDCLPHHLSKGILGGLRWTLYLFLRELGLQELADGIDGLTGEAVGWISTYAEVASTRLEIRSYEPVVPRRIEPSEPPSVTVKERAELMRTVLELANEGLYFEIKEDAIAERANVHPDWFTGLNGDPDKFCVKDDCYTAAFEVICQELIGLLRMHLDTDEAHEEHRKEIQPQLTHQAIGIVLNYLLANPLYARTIASGAFAAGVSATERNIELSREVVGLLIQGVAPQPPSQFVLDAIAGSILHIVGCATEGGSTEQQGEPLLAFWNPLTFIVLTPFIGAERAVATIEQG